MLVVKTEIKRSLISGKGVFCREYVKKGSVVWKFDPSVDILISKDEFDKMRRDMQEEIRIYGFFSPKYNSIIYCNDNSRFTNHSCEPNVVYPVEFAEDIGIASKDILPGDEIVECYCDFSTKDEKNARRFMNCIKTCQKKI